MAKRVVSSVLQRKKPIQKKPIQRTNKRRRLRSIFRKIFDYMKSDTYMFSPLLHPQSSAALLGKNAQSWAFFFCLGCVSFFFLPQYLILIVEGEGFGEAIQRKEKKLVQGLEEYLKRDCYMYAPVLLDSAAETPSTPPTVSWLSSIEFDSCTSEVRSQINGNPSVLCDLIGQSSEKTMRGSGNRVDSFRDIQLDDSYTPSPREQIAIKRAPAQNGAIKHGVRDNYRPKSTRGSTITEGSSDSTFYLSRKRAVSERNS
ncbi:hypothetical protein F511_29596 [Dorcoceras hygrometricum]|uniref:Uncharacterized protein n=1 Tax=Dorcoceras hygrometricum TaxID=472368 RepID=A0A2Z7BTW0_9LAMI|nr:hypothetical protein F511_29596 [Dorcoceras hygrometricum]